MPYCIYFAYFAYFNYKFDCFLTGYEFSGKEDKDIQPAHDPAHCGEMPDRNENAPFSAALILPP